LSETGAIILPLEKNVILMVLKRHFSIMQLLKIRVAKSNPALQLVRSARLSINILV